MLISLCDDNTIERGYIKQLVHDWSLQSGAAVDVREYPSAEALLFDYCDCPPDVLLLDIEMPGMNGVELAKKLRSQAETVQIVFITGYPDFIAEGYDVSALHYLLKPVSVDKLREVLDRAYQTVCENRAPETAIFRSGTESLRFPLSQLEYIAALGHSTVLSAGGRTYDLSVSISEVEKTLGDGFLRCHRSYIVNLRYVRAVSGDRLTLDDGTKIPVARSMKKTVAEAFIQYYKS